jgi:hemerythrin-like domain-containing protein
MISIINLVADFRYEVRRGNRANMKITDRMLSDHNLFRKIMSEIDFIADLPAPHRNIERLGRLSELFNVHMTRHDYYEENFLYYPMLRKAAKSGPSVANAPDVGGLLTDHKILERLTSRLDKQIKEYPASDRWRQDFNVVKELLSEHLLKEERIFPLCEQVLGEATIAHLSRLLERQKAQAGPIIPKLPRWVWGGRTILVFIAFGFPAPHLINGL